MTSTLVNATKQIQIRVVKFIGDSFQRCGHNFVRESLVHRASLRKPPISPSSPQNRPFPPDSWPKKRSPPIYAELRFCNTTQLRIYRNLTGEPNHQQKQQTMKVKGTIKNKRHFTFIKGKSRKFWI